MTIEIIFIYIFTFLSIAGIVYFIGPALVQKWLERHKKKADSASEKLQEMFVFVKGKRLTAVFAILTASLAIFGFLFFKIIGAGIGVVIGLIIPYFVIRVMAKRRQDKFLKQLIDSLMILSSSLKGGLTLLQSFEVLAEEMPAPMSQEFGLLVREVKVGVSLEEALERLLQRMPSDELNLLVSAVLVARETGGDLTKVFSKLVITLRDRSAVKEEVKTLTTQGRVQAIVMSLLPVFFAIWVYKVNPEHFDVMFESELGRFLVGLCIFLEIVGLLLMKKFSIVKI